MERFLDEPSDGQLGNVCKANDISCKRGEIGRLAVAPKRFVETAHSFVWAMGGVDLGAGCYGRDWKTQNRVA